MAVKALNKSDCEWWSNKINRAYDMFKERVKNTIEPMNIDGESKRRYYEKMAREELKKRKFVMYRFARYECIAISENDGDVDFTFSVKFDDKDHQKYTDAKRDKYMEERCQKIRDICEPYQRERDNFLVLIHSRPTQDDLGEIVAWCNKLDKLYENKKECVL